MMLERRALIIGAAAAIAFGIVPRTRAQTAHTATVLEVVDGDTLFIDREFLGSREVRLVGIQTPKLALGRANFKPWPLSVEAKQYLEDLTLDREIELSFGGRRRDRHRRLLAHLHATGADGNRAWIQGHILRAGMGRVYSFPDNRAFVHEMLDIERDARAHKRGIWSHPFYAIRNPNPRELKALVGTFQLVEGRVVDTAKVRGRTYLNFGQDWRTDFTATVAPRDAGTFSGSNFDLIALKGESIRVRGWLEERNGPMMELSHPEEIEILER